MPTKKTTPAKKTTKPRVKKAVATKNVAKAATKKAAPKTAVKKTAGSCAHAACVCKSTCAPDECFWVNNGPVVDSIVHLKVALKDMSDEQFTYHTNRDGNDFAEWIRHCLNDDACATRVAKARSRAGTIRALSCTCCK